jgi:hypothetical protein
MANDQGMFEQSFNSDNGSVSDSTRIAAAFPASPIHDGSINRTSQTNLMVETLTGDQSINEEFGTFSMDYANDVPIINTAAYQAASKLANSDPAAGYPATAFIPNLASPGAIPGATNLNHTTITAVSPPFNPDILEDNTSKPPGSGEGTALSPHVSSTRIGEQHFKELVMGIGSAGTTASGD